MSAAIIQALAGVAFVGLAIASTVRDDSFGAELCAGAALLWFANAAVAWRDR